MAREPTPTAHPSATQVPLELPSLEATTADFKKLHFFDSYCLFLAPHTSGPRDVPRCGALSFLQKDAALQGGSAKLLLG